MLAGFAGGTRPERAEERNRVERAMTIWSAPERNNFFSRPGQFFLRAGATAPGPSRGSCRPPRSGTAPPGHSTASRSALWHGARSAAGPLAKGLDAHRLAARVRYTAHQREQVAGEHAQRGMQRVGVEVAARGMRRAEAAAKLADAALRILAPAVASMNHPRIAPPAEAGRQGPVDVAALRQGVVGLRAVELEELLLAGLSHPLHHHRRRLGRTAHRVQ